MADGWDEMRKAKEESYFDRKNREALERLKKQQAEKPRPSPITGEPMEHVAIGTVIVDRCPTSGGIWLDAGELEQLLEATKGDDKTANESQSVFAAFLKNLTALKVK